MRKSLGIVAAVAIALTAAHAAPTQQVNYTGFTLESTQQEKTSYTLLQGGAIASIVSPNIYSRSYYYSPFTVADCWISTEVRVMRGLDNDFFGFVLGYQPGDMNTDRPANYVLIDWKAGQSAQNGAKPGLAMIQLLRGGPIKGGEQQSVFWKHENPTNAPYTYMRSLARGSSLGGIEWQPFTTYVFDIRYAPTKVEVYVNGKLEMSAAGSFSPGRFGLYNYSQNWVVTGPTYVSVARVGRPFNGTAMLSTAPWRPGQPYAIDVTGAASRSPGSLLVTLQPSAPTVVAPGLVAHVDLTRVLVRAPLSTDSAGQARHASRIPAIPALAGIRLACQAVFTGTGSPPIATTDGLNITIAK